MFQRGNGKTKNSEKNGSKHSLNLICSFNFFMNEIFVTAVPKYLYFAIFQGILYCAIH